MGEGSKRATTNAQGSALQLKPTLRGVSKPPGSRRRLIVPANMRLDRLHDVIHTSMGWTDTHPHMFSTATGDYGVPDPNWDSATSETLRSGSSSSSKATASATRTTSATAGSTTSSPRNDSTPPRACTGRPAPAAREPAHLKTAEGPGAGAAEVLPQPGNSAPCWPRRLSRKAFVRLGCGSPMCATLVAGTSCRAV
jgi:hypothetical protein